MKLRLFQIVSAHLDESADGTIDGAHCERKLATLLPYDQPSKLFETLVAWGRYAEIFDYDENADRITRQQSEAEVGRRRRQRQRAERGMNALGEILTAADVALDVDVADRDRTARIRGVAHRPAAWAARA